MQITPEEYRLQQTELKKANDNIVKRDQIIIEIKREMRNLKDEFETKDKQIDDKIIKEKSQFELEILNLKAKIDDNEEDIKSSKFTISRMN